MAVIADVEDALLAEIGVALGGAVRKTGTLPGGWTLDALQRALQHAPGAYVAFQGARPGATQGYLDGRFTVYAVSKGASETARRRGNARVIGAYDMLERLLPRLSVLTVPGVGSLRVAGVENLFRDAMFELGGTVYGINLDLPGMPFDYVVDPATLDDFVTFNARHDLDPTQDGEPVAEDNLTNLNA